MKTNINILLKKGEKSDLENPENLKTFIECSNNMQYLYKKY